MCLYELYASGLERVGAPLHQLSHVTLINLQLIIRLFSVVSHLLVVSSDCFLENNLSGCTVNLLRDTVNKHTLTSERVYLQS